MTACVLDADNNDFLLATGILEEEFDYGEEEEDEYIDPKERILETLKGECADTYDLKGSSSTHAWLLKAKLIGTGNHYEFTVDDPRKHSIIIMSSDITAVLEFAKDKLLVAIDGILLIVHEWKVVKRVDEPSLTNSGIYWLAKMPGFDINTFPFCISQGSPTFNLINVKEGYNDILIKDTQKHKYGQQAGFLMPDNDSNAYPVSLHFVNRLISSKGLRTSRWHSIKFMKDFKETLEKFHRLPISSLKQTLELKEELNNHKKQTLELKEELNNANIERDNHKKQTLELKEELNNSNMERDKVTDECNKALAEINQLK